jgi:hypothetical protein
MAALIDGMDDDVFAVRQERHRQVASMLPIGIGLVRMSSAHHESLEVQRRCQDILVHWNSKQIAALFPTKHQRWPWIDSLPPDFPDRQAIISRWTGVAHGYLPHGSWRSLWPDFSEATLLFVMDLQEQGWQKSQITELLDQMIAGDEKQMSRINFSIAP